jgi:N-acetylgalactosamine-6-sulfatase
MHWTSLKFLEAREFISKSVKKKQPFFLNLWLDAPHAPYETSTNDLLEKYKERTTGIDLLYRGMVSQLDEGVGTLLVQLNNLGIAENTLVIFTSDNGPAYLGSPAHLKGRKTDFYEGGIRVPMIAWWPGTIKANRSTNVLSNTVDLLPTFVSLSNGKISAENSIDGLDLSPVLLQNESIKNRKTMFWEISSRYKRSSNYKKVTDIRRTPVVNQIARNGKWKLLALEGNALELYNIDEDPYERWNLIKQYPTVANGLYEELLSWMMEPREKKPY